MNPPNKNIQTVITPLTRCVSTFDGSRTSAAGYPNHYTMKKNRIIKLQQTKGKCEICKQKAQVVHHIDESSDNHSIDNLLAVCSKCHKCLHHPDRVDAVFKTSKYIRLYGATLEQLSKRTGLTTNRVYEMHYKGELKGYLKELILSLIHI